MLTTFFVVLLSAVASSGLLSLIIARLSKFLLYKPNARSSHLQPIPSGGGVTFVLIGSVSSSICLVVASRSVTSHLPLVAASLLVLPLSVVGFLDDLYNLPHGLRYAVQILTAFFIILTSPLIVPSFILLPFLLILLIAITAVINFINFMDGLDGLVAGCMSFAIASAAIQLNAPMSIWALVGALLGFLIWNWSPATVFMGDVGSTFLGAMFALLALQASTWPESISLLLMATPLLGDAFFCVLRRLLARQRIFQPHRLHLFQRLHQAGWTHRQVSSLYIVSTAFLSVASPLWGLSLLIVSVAIILFIGIWLDQNVAVPFAVASRL